MPLINFSGIASGIDSNALIDATSQAARILRVLPKENNIAELEATNKQLSQLKGLLTSLQSSVLGFATVSGGVVKRMATSSDETVVTSSASNSAANGTYSLTVTNLAKNATLALGNDTTPYSSASAAINSSIDPPEGDDDDDIIVTVGEDDPSTPDTNEQSTITIRVTNSMTLNDFVSAFNDAALDKAVATVVNVGSETVPNYKVIITSTNTGISRGQIAFTVEAGPAAGFVDQTLTPAENAIFSISGIGSSIERGSNTVSNVITGVTFELKSLGSATITVKNDTSATQAKIKQFVDQYNQVVSLIQLQSKIERVEGKQGKDAINIFGPLALTRVDDNAIVAIRAAMSSSTHYNGGTPQESTNELRILADLGITTDSGAFNPETGTGGGTLKFDTAKFADAMSKEPNSVSEILKKFGDTAGLTGGTIDQFTRFGGLIESVVNSNKSQIDDLNKQISQAEAAILQQEATMRQRFSRLEALIGQLQSQQSALTSALASLPRLNR